MNAQELVVWSMALGAIASVALVRTADLVARPSLAQLQGIAYHFTVFMLVLVLCGLPAVVGARPNERLAQVAQVLAGPVCLALAHFWIRGWLKASQRDRFTSTVLRASALVLPPAGLACLLLPPAQQLPAAAAVSLLGAVITFWVTLRAWLLGDALANLMALGCFFTIPAIGGLYATAAHVPAMTLALQAATAIAAVLANSYTGLVLWRRDRHERRTRRPDDAVSQFDAVTKLDSGAGLVRKMIQAQRRRNRTGRDGAVIAVRVFDIDKLAQQIGTAGLNEMFIVLASRIQRQVGVVNTVGRYYDSCFVSLVETIQSPGWLRTVGLRVASNLRRPIPLTTFTGDRVEVRVDIGVGVVHLSRGHQEVEDVLDDAQRMAQAARELPSRAAMLDPATGLVVGVEEAQLGPRRVRSSRAAAPAG